MTQLVIDLNSLIFDPSRGGERLAAVLLVVAAVAGLSGNAEGGAKCAAAGLLLLSRRATRRC